MQSSDNGSSEFSMREAAPWSALKILASPETLYEIEDEIIPLLDDAGIVGTSRETWLDPSYAASLDASICDAETMPQRLVVYLERDADPTRAVARLTEILELRFADVIGKQLLRCGTSIGANYRAACRAKSPADFIAKMKIVEEECDESIYWMEMIVESGLMPENRVAGLLKEASEILSMIVASLKTARSRK